ncbi:hypothetical protein ACFYMW_24440 [Streptomyces sp. NPDC006692]
METIVDTLTTPWEGVLAEPVGGSAVGVLVLAGSRQAARNDRNT